MSFRNMDLRYETGIHSNKVTLTLALMHQLQMQVAVLIRRTCINKIELK